MKALPWLPALVIAVASMAGAGAGACGRDDQVSADFGAACEGASDCAAGVRCLPNPTWPNGFCTRDCEADEDCPSSAICVDTDDGNVCLFACNEGRDCEFLSGDTPELWGCEEFANGPEVRFACGGN